MAKARNITSVRDRAVKAWHKAKSEIYSAGMPTQVRKSRSRKTITVATRQFGYDPVTWSYKGGSLRRVNA